ncbi:MAG: CehA/McbA family metallohydrolase [Calditrichaeota bacterium]|nr:CehA/McbA family metallohydrolase [Calditrichota bacterium]MCB0268637.1 CehA/McbA family metallohydrolase [Calditrichota bacterium]
MIRKFTLFNLLILLLLAQSCATRQNWYRGNTHAHTVLCGHADSAPDVVAKWYLDHGYNFVILSEHNRFINPDSVMLPDNRRSDFILIPGEEISGKKIIHTTAMNIRELADWQFDSEQKSQIIQSHVDNAMAAGGQAILNHPNYYYAASAADVLQVQRLIMFELFNGHPQVNVWGDETHPSTEEMWDFWLSKGMKIFAVSSDDAHHFQTWGADQSNPGRGWVMVNSQKLSPDAITDAMVRGEFYASNGVFLKRAQISEKQYLIEVDESRTAAELATGLVVGKSSPEGLSGWKIEFIGKEGELLDSKNGTKAVFSLPDGQPFVRAKVTFTRPAESGFESFFAWIQPLFNDGRR